MQKYLQILNPKSYVFYTIFIVHKTGNKITKTIRSSTVEPVLGTLLGFQGMRKVYTKGIDLANKHVLLASTAYNIKKMLKFKAVNAICQVAVGIVDCKTKILKSHVNPILEQFDQIGIKLVGIKIIAISVSSERGGCATVTSAYVG